MVFTHPVQSLITNPNGQVVVNNSEDITTYIITEIDLQDVDRRCNRPMGPLKDCRTEIYVK